MGGGVTSLLSRVVNEGGGKGPPVFLIRVKVLVTTGKVTSSSWKFRLTGVLELYLIRYDQSSESNRSL